MISTWAGELRQARLLSDVRYPTSYPETGRWGSGPAMSAAEAVFAADSRAVLAQLRQPARPARQALVAAHAVAIAIAFTGSTADGMTWLTSHVPAPAPVRIPRPVYTEAVRIADPACEWAALRAAQGGTAIVDAWAERQQAIAAYRACFPGTGTSGISPDDILTSLLHLHHVRAFAIDFPDEAECMYLARAAALSWTARSTGGHQ